MASARAPAIGKNAGAREAAMTSASWRWGGAASDLGPACTRARSA